MKFPSQFYIRSVILALVGIALGVLTIHFGLQPSHRTFVFNTDYTPLGYALRGSCLLCGIVSLYYAILSIVRKETLRGSLAALLLGWLSAVSFGKWRSLFFLSAWCCLLLLQ